MFNLFRRQKSPDPGDFVTQLKSDLHSHLIFGVDDGAKRLEDSLKLIERMKDLGYQNVTTTPHIMADLYPNTSDFLREREAIIRNEIERKAWNINFSCAAEYLLDDGFEQKMETGDLMLISDRYLLIEMGFYEEFGILDQIIFKLKLKGYFPVLAHVERYPYYYSDFDRLENLLHKGVLFQLNLFSLFGHYGEPVKKMAQYLLDKQYYHFIGTDLHNELQLDTWLSSWKKMPKEARRLMEYSFDNHRLN